MSRDRDDTTGGKPGGGGPSDDAGEDRSFAPARPARTPDAGADVGDDAQRGQNGRKLGDPLNARRRVPSHRATGGINGGSGAD